MQMCVLHMHITPPCDGTVHSACCCTPFPTRLNLSPRQGESQHTGNILTYSLKGLFIKEASSGQGSPISLSSSSAPIKGKSASLWRRLRMGPGWSQSSEHGECVSFGSYLEAGMGERFADSHFSNSLDSTHFFIHKTHDFKRNKSFSASE